MFEKVTGGLWCETIPVAFVCDRCGYEQASTLPLEMPAPGGICFRESKLPTSHNGRTGCDTPTLCFVPAVHVRSERDTQVITRTDLLPSYILSPRKIHECMRRFVLVHLKRHADKQECLLFMLRKLYAFVQGRCREDRPDALANHELLLPGHLFGMIVKERVENWLEKVRLSLLWE